MQVFPVRKSFDTQKKKWNKHPAVPKGVDWREYKATPDELDHSANIGICIPDGVVVIDLDTQKGVTREAVESALGCALDWDDALLQATVSGGEHYAFALPQDVTVRQGDSLLGVPGFDTRCAGKGWICSGEGYDDKTLLGLPDALYDWEWPGLPDTAVAKLQTMSVSSGGDDDLMSMVASQPLEDITLDDMAGYVARLPAGDLNQYDAWLKTGMACHHQTGGKKEGFRIWHDWSKDSEHYDLEELKAKWRSFGKHTGDTVKFSYVIHRAGGKGAVSQSLLDTLEVKIAQAQNRDDYFALRDEIRAIPRAKLPDDARSMLANMIVETVGKDIGLNATEVKKALIGKKNRQAGGEPDRPEWVEPWVYVEITCEFANTLLNYSIKRDAFNAKYDRTPDAMMAEKAASTLALNDYQIPTVVDKMFWPGAEELFEHDGKAMLNAYRPSGAEAAAHIDEDGQAVIDMLLKHVAFTLSCKREQTILLDWISYVVQNPGKRINWALLLQGAQGVGKSYFVAMMQYILGANVSNLDPTAIAGRFTGWAHGSLVVAVEEIRISGTNKYEVLDRLKPFLTNDTVQIEEKGRDHRTVPNFTSYFMLTNHKDAIPLTDGDRRYCVLFSRVQTEEQLLRELGGLTGVDSYFSKLFDETARRADALKTFFLTRQISSEFSARGRAPKTSAREQMVSAAVSPERSTLEDMIAVHECEVINDALLDITWLNHLVIAEGGELPKTRTLSAILFDMGYEQVPGRRVKVAKTGNYHYIWKSVDIDHVQVVRDFFND